MRMIIRADADGGRSVGVGHVLRCIALSQAWVARGGEAILATAFCVKWVRDLAKRAGIRIVDLVPHDVGSRHDMLSLVQMAEVDCEADWVVVDGYRFGAPYMAGLNAIAGKVLMLDDYYHCLNYYSDMILSPMEEPTNERYTAMHDGERKLRVLAGLEYALIRRDFRAVRARRRVSPSRSKKVFIGMGGTDAHGVGAKVAEQIRGMGFTPVFPEPKKSVARVMDECGLAVVNGGVTSLEAASIGLPSVVIPLVDNQRVVAARLDKSRAAIIATSLDQLPGCLDEVRMLGRTIAVNAMKLVDGFGAERVVDAMLEKSDRRPPHEMEDH